MSIDFGEYGVNTQDESIRFLLIVRERLRPGSDEAYDRNERRLAEICAALNCPHSYIALVPTGGLSEVWWFNAFESEQERDGLEAAYARNEPLMIAMIPLGRQKDEFRQSFTSTMTEHQRNLSNGAMLKIIGSRFFVVSRTTSDGRSVGAVFESPDGERFVIASAHDRPAAETIAAQFGAGATILAVHPQWSFPAPAWIDADREFWKDSPAARNSAGVS